MKFLYKNIILENTVPTLSVIEFVKNQTSSTKSSNATTILVEIDENENIQTDKNDLKLLTQKYTTIQQSSETPLFSLNISTTQVLFINNN